MTERRDRRSEGQRLRITGPLLATALFAAVLTAVVPSLSFAERSAAAHAAIETAAILIAGLAAALVAGRALRSGSRNELLLATALGMLSVANLVFALLPAIFGWPTGFSTWGGLTGRVAGAALFAAAALLPDRTVDDARGLALRILATAVGGFVVVTVLAAALAGSLPEAIDPGLSPEEAGLRIVGNPVVLALQALMVALYAAAAAGFARRAEQRADRLLAGFAIAALVSAFARLNYFLFPSLYSNWVFTGDFLRLAHYLVILGVVARELLEYQRRAAAVAVLDERRRVARELHDGLAQELAYIKTESRRLDRSAEGAGALVSAADRAIEESRTAIATLSRPIDEPLLDMLRHSAEAVALRSGVRVVAEGEAPAHVDPQVRHALSRIVREATVNAVRHGGAKTVTVRVVTAGGLRVTVADDGSGFDDAADARPGAYGLLGMRDRAAALGGDLDVTSRPGSGTTVSVVLA